jgi:hypothetical protein
MRITTTMVEVRAREFDQGERVRPVSAYRSGIADGVYVVSASLGSGVVFLEGQSRSVSAEDLRLADDDCFHCAECWAPLPIGSHDLCPACSQKVPA